MTSFRCQVSVTDGSGALKKSASPVPVFGSSYWPQFVISTGTGRCEKSIWAGTGTIRSNPQSRRLQLQSRRSNRISRLDKSWTTHKRIRRSFVHRRGWHFDRRRDAKVPVPSVHKNLGKHSPQGLSGSHGTSCRFIASSHHFRSSPTLLPHLFFPELWTTKPSCNTVLTRTPMI